jgi:hypothetical protein
LWLISCKYHFLKKEIADKRKKSVEKAEKRERKKVENPKSQWLSAQQAAASKRVFMVSVADERALRTFTPISAPLPLE